MTTHTLVTLSQPLDVSGVYVPAREPHFDRMDMTYIPYEPARFKDIVALTDLELKACEEALMESCKQNKERE
jgi:hypothetical protein